MKLSLLWANLQTCTCRSKLTYKSHHQSTMHTYKDNLVCPKQTIDGLTKASSNSELLLSMPGAKRSWSLNSNERLHDRSAASSGLNNRLYRSMQSPTQFVKPLPTSTSTPYCCSTTSRTTTEKSKCHNLNVAISGLNSRMYRSMQSPKQFVKPPPNLTSTTLGSLTTMDKSKLIENFDRKPVVDIIGMHILVLYDDDNEETRHILAEDDLSDREQSDLIYGES
jgi:hypothetical protein